MDGNAIAAIAASGAALALFALLAALFWHGRSLALLAGPSAADPANKEDCRALARHMAVVLMAACALMATLIVYLAGGLARAASVASAASMANNVAFVAFVIALIWFFMVQRPKDDERPAGKAAPRRRSLDHLHIATIAFVVVLLAVVGAIGAVAASL